eukprot:NODE_10536_length_588_cov_51.290323_g10259_i0.p1 GENE.NODE_10536_length_588_cov_51.290323_g10259_i0~~NODE_10536_length_588_cov_51.290323_g10259_i0.p1  ORF type:complete len:139 (+),score=14.63 NODE_10536_length_588_cov_51.290323_g10259_i0:61-477(+)
MLRLMASRASRLACVRFASTNTNVPIIRTAPNALTPWEQRRGVEPPLSREWNYDSLFVYALASAFIFSYMAFRKQEEMMAMYHRVRECDRVTDVEVSKATHARDEIIQAIGESQVRGTRRGLQHAVEAALARWTEQSP